MMLRYSLLLISVVLLLIAPVTAQDYYAGQDTLQEITVTGKAMVDTSTRHAKFFIDTDADSLADFRLNFGPFWYTPDSSEATRPQDGDAIKILGYLSREEADSLPVIIVAEINDLFWRDFYQPRWNPRAQNRGRHHHRHSFRNHHGFAFGWFNSDSVQVVDVEGVALVDSNFHFPHYYLDADLDTMPDYFLNFGPPWYQPETDISKPQHGDTVQITGALMERAERAMILVFEINGEVWLDSTGLGSQMGAGWIHKNMNRNRYIRAPFDSLSGLRIPANWNDGMGHMKMMERMYMQILQLFPQNVPQSRNQIGFAAFEIGAFNHRGQNMMLNNDSVGGTMSFAEQVNLRFHYNDIQVKGFNVDEQQIQLKVWNRNHWQVVEDAQIDTENNTVSYASATVNGVYVLSGPSAATNLDNEQSEVPGSFTLQQNYPNPFNPKTTISFTLNEDSKVTLSIYNVLGQEIEQAIDTRVSAGRHSVEIDGNNWPSGIYFYELKTEQGSAVRKMTLMK
ncbi:MAG: T9SS type A sorting domain-containing protein [Caldithrix sp.]|nr:T9SS type A sorting domain-containing protein [Caldithrix sp.]